MNERKPRPIKSTKGNAMYFATILFFVSFAMAVFAVYTYQRASDTVYDRLVLDLHATKSELAVAKNAYETAASEAKDLAEIVARASEKIEALERRSTVVQMPPLPKTWQVEIVDAPVRIPAGYKIDHSKLKPKQKRVTQ